jgi:hypothetical protein
MLPPGQYLHGGAKARVYHRLPFGGAISRVDDQCGEPEASR